MDSPQSPLLLKLKGPFTSPLRIGDRDRGGGSGGSNPPKNRGGVKILNFQGLLKFF